MPCWASPEISYAPLRERLGELIDHLRPLEEEVEFAVLFGSCARGEEAPGSDLDVLVGLRREGGERFLDRIDRFTGLCRSAEVFPYYPGEIGRMEQQLHFTLLEAADHGRVLFDRGGWRSLAGRIRRLVEEGRVVRHGRGWWVRDASLLASG